MSRLLSRWQQPNAEGRTQSVTPESAGWGYVGFEAYELQEGQVLTLQAPELTSQLSQAQPCALHQ